MKVKLLAATFFALVVPEVAFAQDAGANADAYATAVCGYGGYAAPELSYQSYEECYASEFAKHMEWYPQDNGGGDPPSGYTPPPVPMRRCTGRIDCKVE